ncbi:hypothetical protein ACLOAV_003718 [Pseudogymnoascus australis]
MHPLAHAWAKDRQELAKQGQTWMSTACIFALSFTIDEYSSHKDHLLYWKSLLNIGVKTAFSLGPEPMVISIFLTCGLSLEIHREDSRLGTLLYDIFSTLGIKLDTPSIEYLGIYKIYALYLAHIGDSASSLQLLIQIAKIQDETLPRSHYKRLISQHELGRVYADNGEVEMAIKLLEQVVEDQEDLPITTPRRLASQHELARVYLAKGGKVKEAIEILEQVVKIREEVLPIAHSNRLTSQHELARVYLQNGQAERAQEIFEHVVKIREEVLSITHSDRLLSQHELGHAYLENGQFEQAIRLLEHVVKIREEVLPMSHSLRLASQHELAYAYHTDGQVEKAIELLEHVVKIEGEVLPANHSSRLISERALALFKEEA